MLIYRLAVKISLVRLAKANIQQIFGILLEVISDELRNISVILGPGVINMNNIGFLRGY